MRAVFALATISAVAGGGALLAARLAPGDAGQPAVAGSVEEAAPAPVPLPAAPDRSRDELDRVGAAGAPAPPRLSQESDADLAVLARGDGPLGERRAALELLAFRHSPELLDAALVALSAPEGELRAAASAALETLGDPRAASALRRAYEAEPEPAVRRTMALALRSLEREGSRVP